MACPRTFTEGSSMYGKKILQAAVAVALCAPIGLATIATANGKVPSQPRYRVVDMGSLGGDLGILQGRSVNLRRMAVGLMGTGELDPFCDFDTEKGCYFDGTMYHAFLYANGKTYDLGALAKGVNSTATGITELGLVYGSSQTGAIDPGTGWPEAHAVAWVNKRSYDLGTLGGTQSVAVMANLIGQTVGGALTAKSNPFAKARMGACPWTPIVGPGANGLTFAENTFIGVPATTETHATYWWGSAKIDMGTLGGPDSVAVDINDFGHAAGWSYTSYQPNSGFKDLVLDVHPFVWSAWDRKMHDLGTLGGACAVAVAINNRGQVAGYSTLADNTTSRPFIWTARDGMRNLGTLGGPYAHANHMNDRGEVIGYSTMLQQGQAPANVKGRAFYWYGGKLKNLGTFGDDYSDANGINNHGQIVGETFDPCSDPDIPCRIGRGWISDRGGPIVDLNTLIDPHSGYRITAGAYITDAGVIGARAITANGDEHPVMLVPTR